MKFKAVGIASLGLLLLSAMDPAVAAGSAAVAELKLADGTSAGTVTLSEMAAGVLLKIDLKGLPPGPHGFHVHEAGKCEADFSSAGQIYNPLGAKHGFLNDEGPMAGDLPNIVAGPDGAARAEMMSTYLHLNMDGDDTLFGPAGTAIVVYEKADDYQTDPDGGAGKRVACGVIQKK
jgi:superoxide dismutase, Cu-Zn family